MFPNKSNYPYLRIYFSFLGASYYKDKPIDPKYATKRATADLIKQVDSGTTSVADAKEEIRQKVRNGELTTKQGTALQKNIKMSLPGRTALNLDAASEENFSKIETFAKEVPAENREEVYKILWNKYQNKLKGNVDPATRNQANRLKAIIEKSFPAERAAARERANQ